MAVLMFIMRRTQFGRAMRAVAESPKAAWLLGINVEKLFMTTSFAAAALGSVAGGAHRFIFQCPFPVDGAAYVAQRHCRHHSWRYERHSRRYVGWPVFGVCRSIVRCVYLLHDARRGRFWLAVPDFACALAGSVWQSGSTQGVRV